MLLIDGQDPFVAVNYSALVSGGYQSFATRQNMYELSVCLSIIQFLFIQPPPCLGSFQVTIAAQKDGNTQWEDLPSKYIP